MHNTIFDKHDRPIYRLYYIIHYIHICKSDTLYDIRQIYMKQIADISPEIFVLSDNDKLYYLLKGIDTEITPIFGKWLCEINKAYSPKSKT